MTRYITGMTHGLMIATVLILAGAAYKSAAEPSAEEEARDYHAYRSCIHRSSCTMTAQDWIDYYELKWRIEGE